jgi:hypothetical protein
LASSGLRVVEKGWTFLTAPYVKRYLVPDAEDGNGWVCRGCGSDLHLVALNVPGKRDEVAEALHAAPVDLEKRESPS